LLSRLVRRKPSQTKKGRKGELVGFWSFVFCSPGTADSVFHQPLVVLKTPKTQRKRERRG
jgi:hypothetical protein